MQLADFASSCARRGGQAIARRISSHAVHHRVHHMIRHAAYRLAAHSHRVPDLTCHWLPIALTVGIIGGAPVHLLELPGRSVLPSRAPARAGAPSAGGFDAGASSGAAEAGGGFFQANAPMQAGTGTIAATVPEAALAQFLLPLYSPVELTLASLPVATVKAGPSAGPMLDATLPADLPATLPDRSGPLPPARRAVPSLAAVAEVPEPSTAFLLSGSALALLLLRRRKGQMLLR